MTKGTKPSTPIKAQQKRVIWSIAKKSLQMDSEELYAVIDRMFGKERMSDMTYWEAERLISELKRVNIGLADGGLTPGQFSKIIAMGRDFGWPDEKLSNFIKREIGIDNIKWLDADQARKVITGLEKVRTWYEDHSQEAANGV